MRRYSYFQDLSPHLTIENALQIGDVIVQAASRGYFDILEILQRVQAAILLNRTPTEVLTASSCLTSQVQTIGAGLHKKYLQLQNAARNDVLRTIQDRALLRTIAEAILCSYADDAVLMNDRRLRSQVLPRYANGS